MEQPAGQTAAPRPALSPHSYPGWVRAVALVVALLAIYSATHIPRYYRAARAMDRAAVAGAAGEHQRAANILLAALRTLPDSSRLRIEFAYQAFQCHDADEHVMAMAALKGIDIPPEQWRRLKPVIPPQDLSKFETVESK